MRVADTFGFLNAIRSSHRIPVGAAEEEAEKGGAAASAAAAGKRTDNLLPGGREAARRPERDVKMDVVLALLWLLTGSLQSVHGQGVYGKRVTCALTVFKCLNLKVIYQPPV